METFSSSVSTTLKVPSTLLPTPSREILHQFKTYYKLPPQTHQHLHKTTKPATTTTFTSKPLTSATPTFSIPTKILASSQNLHKNPASGFAAALIDIAQCNRTLDLVHRDVKVFLKLLQNKSVEAVLESPFVGLEEKSQVMKLVAQKGRFNKHVVNLVKILVGKSKVGIIKEILEEFGRIYSELCGSGTNHGLLRGLEPIMDC